MDMSENSAADYLPADADIPALRHAAVSCQGCELYEHAQQTVFGAGNETAAIMLVGEQPGDTEDRRGQPFVGPAGRLLDRALDDAAIDRDQLYVTNAVKHFKFRSTESGKRRIHQKPNRTEVVACRPWLLAELHAVEPEVVVLLGATAAQSLLGNDFRLTHHRGETLHLPADAVPDGDILAIATAHPSSILRLPRSDSADAYHHLVADLRRCAELLG